MDNNKKVQMNKLEYENMNTISAVNAAQNAKSQVNTNISEEFKSLIKKAGNIAKKKNMNSEKNIKDDILVEDSLKELIKRDHEINKTVKVKITESTLIKKLLSNEETKPSNKACSK